MMEKTGEKETIRHQTIEEALSQVLGCKAKILRSENVFGGDINEASCLTLENGEQVFLKTNTAANVSFFEAEALGLSALSGTGAIGVPKVFAYGVDEKRKRSYLLMEYQSAGKPVKNQWEIFAAELAAMHRADTKKLVPGGCYGFLENNYIGSGKQENTPKESWVAFFRECRLEPQIKRAEGYFDGTFRKRLQRLLDRLPELLVEPQHPSLLHGDLWSGNVITGHDGKLWLIDPAVSVGHAEADLAMTELFGGFSGRFYEAYKEAGSLRPGYADRRDLYNLYHLLNHLNLFGGSYLGSVRRIVEYYT